MKKLIIALRKPVDRLLFASKEKDFVSYQRNYDQSRRQWYHSNKYAAAVSVRQLSEWSMQAFQASFPYLQYCIHYEERGERKLILQLAILLFNFRASTVGPNKKVNI